MFFLLILTFNRRFVQWVTVFFVAVKWPDCSTDRPVTVFFVGVKWPDCSTDRPVTVFFVAVKWPECSTDRPQLSSAEIMNNRPIILFPLCAFMTCRRENVTFTFTFTFTFICFGTATKRNAFRSQEGCFCLWTCHDVLGAVQANIRRPLTTECRVRIQACLLEVCYALSGSGTCFPLRISGSHCQYHSTNVPLSSTHLHTHVLSNWQRCYITHS